MRGVLGYAATGHQCKVGNSRTAGSSALHKRHKHAQYVPRLCPVRSGAEWHVKVGCGEGKVVAQNAASQVGRVNVAAASQQRARRKTRVPE